MTPEIPTPRPPLQLPIFGKLLILLLLMAVVPLTVASVLMIRGAIQAVQSTVQQNLQLVAAISATRLDQLLQDTAQLQYLMASAAPIRDLAGADDKTHPDIARTARDRLESIVNSHPDLAAAFVTDLHGMGLVSTNPKTLGMDLSFRDYIQQALRGRQCVSDLLVAKSNGDPGIYFSGPIRDTNGQVTGVLVLKLDAAAIDRVCRDSGARVSNGFVGMSDEFGVIISSPRQDILYKSIGTLSSEAVRQINPQLRYGVEQLESLEINELARKVAGATQPSSALYISRQGQPMVAGFARLKQKPWTIQVVQPRSDFDAPLRQLLKQQIWTVLAVILVAALASYVASVRLTTPLRNLTAAARRIAAGDWSARARITTRDEIGDLGHTFNEMVPMLKHRTQMEHALQMAREIQRQLLPASAPAIPGLDTAGISIPADQTGGDYFDYLDLTQWRPGTLAVAIGDVTGHGISAALLMATARAILRSHATPPGPLADLVALVNGQLYHDTPTERFMTLLYAVVDRPNCTVRVCSAGHDPIIAYSPATDQFRDLQGQDIPLAIDANWQFNEVAYDQLPNDSVLAFGTDGIWETQSPNGEMFGKDRLRDLIRAHHARPAAEMVIAITAALSDFRGSEIQEDDVTLIVIRFIPPASSNPQGATHALSL